MSLYTAIPVKGSPKIGKPEAARAVLALPVVGLLLSLPTAGVLLVLDAGGQSTARRLLAATVALGLLSLLTGGLHLDGLADTGDGLGSRRPAEEALAIMRRSDIGPLGVATLFFVLVAQITALASIPASTRAAAALVAAVVTARVAVVLATGPSSPPARPGGFGALVAAATSTRARTGTALLLLAAVVVTGGALAGPALALRALAGVLAGLGAAELLRRYARQRLGGMTGDVFGALIEVSTATVLVVLALAG
jgi:adenosylcobinamide-GDP ribazoletransferase